MDNMPPLPWLLQRADAHYIGEELAAAVHAYARAYAEQRCAPLVEALRNLIEAADSMRGTYGVIWGDTPEDCDTFTHDPWAEDFLKERADEARASLKAQEKHHG